jgi:hypothetical protein
MQSTVIFTTRQRNSEEIFCLLKRIQMKSSSRKRLEIRYDWPGRGSLVIINLVHSHSSQEHSELSWPGHHMDGRNIL